MFYSIVNLFAGIVCIGEIVLYNLTLGSKVKQLLDIQTDPDSRDRLYGILNMILARDIIETIIMIATVIISAKYKEKRNLNFGISILDYGCTLFFRAEIINLLKTYNEEAPANTTLDSSDPVMVIYWTFFIVGWLSRLVTVTKLIYCNKEDENEHSNTDIEM